MKRSKRRSRWVSMATPMRLRSPMSGPLWSDSLLCVCVSDRGQDESARTIRRRSRLGGVGNTAGRGAGRAGEASGGVRRMPSRSGTPARRYGKRASGPEDSGSASTIELRALAGGGSISDAGRVLLSSKRPSGAAGGAIAERISPAANPTGTRSRSSFHADLDGGDARDSGSGASSTAAAGEDDLRSRPLESDFPGQQSAGVAAAEGVRVVADSDERSAHPRGSV